MRTTSSVIVGLGLLVLGSIHGAALASEGTTEAPDHTSAGASDAAAESSTAAAADAASKAPAPASGWRARNRLAVTVHGGLAILNPTEEGALDDTIIAFPYGGLYESGLTVEYLSRSGGIFHVRMSNHVEGVLSESMAFSFRLISVGGGFAFRTPSPRFQPYVGASVGMGLSDPTPIAFTPEVWLVSAFGGARYMVSEAVALEARLGFSRWQEVGSAEVQLVGSPSIGVSVLF